MLGSKFWELFGTIWYWWCQRLSMVSRVNRFNFFPISLDDDWNPVFANCCCCCCCCLDLNETPLEVFLNVGEGDVCACSRSDCCRLRGGGGGGGGEFNGRFLTYFRLKRLWFGNSTLISSSSEVSLELSWLIAATWARSSLDDECVLDCARTNLDGWWWSRRCWCEVEVRSVNCGWLRCFWWARTEDDPAKDISVELSTGLFGWIVGDRRRRCPSFDSSCLRRTIDLMLYRNPISLINYTIYLNDYRRKGLRNVPLHCCDHGVVEMYWTNPQLSS